MKLQKIDLAIRKRLWVGILLVLGVVFLLSAVRYLRPQEAADRPELGLMTSLPLLWSEGGIEAALDADAAPHPVHTRLSTRYEVIPLDSLDQIDKLTLLVLAQPRALAPAELVKLDQWVRRGGRLLLLADPALQWGSLYPIGDSRRPLFTSLLSPLFARWGLELVLPIGSSEPMSVHQIDNFGIRTQTPGEWRPTRAGAAAACRISKDPMVAECAVGRGRAVLIADADLLDTPYWQGQGARLLTGSDEYGNMQWIEATLGELRGGDIVGN